MTNQNERRETWRAGKDGRELFFRDYRDYKPGIET